MATDDYRRLSIVQKRALDLARARDAAVRCPHCEMQVMPADMSNHLTQRCAGRPDPGAGAKWVSWRDALAQGVPRETLARWARSGFVRYIGERQDRKYLLGDLVKRIAQRHGFRRR